MAKKEEAKNRRLMCTWVSDDESESYTLYRVYNIIKTGTYRGRDVVYVVDDNERERIIEWHSGRNAMVFSDRNNVDVYAEFIEVEE
jgi:hypothetical protein